MKLSINILTSLKLLSFVIMITIVLLFLIIFLCYDELNIRMFSYMFLPYFFLFVLPTIILHFNYYQYSNNYSIEINENKIIVVEKDKQTTYNSEEIKEITFVMTKTKKLNSGVSFFLFDGYFYASIMLLNGEVIYVTCLLSSKIDEILISSFKDVKFTTEVMFYPIVYNAS